MKRARALKFFAYTIWYAVVFGLALVVLFFVFDFNSLKSQIEAQTSELLEQKVRIKGNIHPGYLATYPALVMHGVEIGADVKADAVTVAVESRKPLLKVLVHASGLTFKDQPLGDYDIPVTAYPTGFKIDALKGELGTAALTGSVKYIDENLHIDVILKDVPLARLAEEADGKVDIKIQLDSKGDDAAKLIRALDGRFILTSGSGKLTSKSLNFWSRDLLRNFLPGSSASVLNCAIIDFDIKNSIAESRALVVDTDENTIIGKGSIDLDKQTVDLILKPNPKDVSLVNLSTPVRVTGPFSNTVVTPQMGGMAKKIGGLLLDVVNPAFALLPVLQSGFDDYHGSCADIIKQHQPPKKP